ncbi:MAG: hypothetical protein K0M45_01115 [Candidatus Paracaedibacteraceae bacterium]|nr:hypothetical protein [Candidatus Paracaedibacteraceae bacterium]
MINNASSCPIKLMLRNGTAEAGAALRTTAMDITPLKAGSFLSLRSNNLKSDYQNIKTGKQTLELTLILPMNEFRLPYVWDNIPLGSEIKLEDAIIPSQYLLTLGPPTESYTLTFKATVNQNFWVVAKK